MSLTLHPVGVPSFEASTCTSVIWSALIHKSPSFRNCGMVHLVFRPWLGRSLAAASWGSAVAAAGIVANVWADRAVPPQLVDEGKGVVAGACCSISILSVPRSPALWHGRL